MRREGLSGRIQEPHDGIPGSGRAHFTPQDVYVLRQGHGFGAAYTACHQALQISENLPDPTCLIASLQTLGIIQVWHGEAETALAAFDRANPHLKDVTTSPDWPATLRDSR